MSNFIPMVYATLKNEGIDTKGMSTDEAVKKYKELQEKSGGKVGEKEGTPAENKRLTEKGILDEKQLKLLPKIKTEHLKESIEWFEELYEKHKDKESGEQIKKFIDAYKDELSKRQSVEDKRDYDTSIENNMEIDWDLAEKNEKENGKFAKNPNRHDKYGNELLSDEAFKVGAEAGKSYLDYQNKYGNDLQKLKKSNVFLSGIGKVIGNAITNNGFDPKQDMTYTDYNQIIGSLIGEEVDMEKYESRQSNGFTGRKYIDYQPK